MVFGAHHMMEITMKNFLKTTLFVTATVAAVAGVTAFANSDETSAEQSLGNGEAVTIYRDPGCGCCDVYAAYMVENGFDVTLVDDANFDQRSVDAGVPERGIGCHLAMIDGYLVSGLVPAEIVNRLLEERPDIKGITLPGMPGNAPGMARSKTGTLKVYAFGEAGISVYSNE